jgi:hypothetical protein
MKKVNNTLSIVRHERKKQRFTFDSCKDDLLRKERYPDMMSEVLKVNNGFMMQQILSYLPSPWEDMHSVYKARHGLDPWGLNWDPALNISKSVQGATDAERERLANPTNHQNWIVASVKHNHWEQFSTPLRCSGMQLQYRGLPVLGCSKALGGSSSARPIWWGLRFLFTLVREHAVVCRVVGTNSIGYQVVLDEDLNWTRCISGRLINSTPSERKINVSRVIPFTRVALMPELMSEADETVCLYPSRANVKFNDVATMALRSRYAGYPDLRSIRYLYATAMLGKVDHPNPVITENTHIPMSGIGVKWCEHYATPISVAFEQSGSQTSIQFSGLLDHKPKMPTKDFILHKMCENARLRYTIRLWVYAFLCNGSIKKTEHAVAVKKKEVGAGFKKHVELANFYIQRTTPHTTTLDSSTTPTTMLRVGKDSNADNAWKRPFFAYYGKTQRVHLMQILTAQFAELLVSKDYIINGVSERTFNDTLFNTMSRQKCMFNDFMLVNSFIKKTNSWIWSISGTNNETITLMFACENGIDSPSTTTMAIFREQHAHDPALVGFVEKQPAGRWNKQGSRQCPVIVSKCTLARQEQYKVSPILKGSRHCAQRVIAAALHLKFSTSITELSVFMNLPAFKSLGPDTDYLEINKALLSTEAKQWLFLRSGFLRAPFPTSTRIPPPFEFSSLSQFLCLSSPSQLPPTPPSPLSSTLLP